jgi:hypothetical protein
VRAEAVYLVFHRALKSAHDEKRNNGGAKSNADGNNCDLMDGGRKSACLVAADSFRYEIRKVQNYGLILALPAVACGEGRLNHPRLIKLRRAKQSKENDKDFQCRSCFMSADLINSLRSTKGWCGAD